MTQINGIYEVDDFYTKNKCVLCKYYCDVLKVTGIREAICIRMPPKIAVIENTLVSPWPLVLPNMSCGMWESTS